MAGPLHFYVVFNPLLKPTENHLTQAHEFHHLLKSKVKSEGRNSHLYWGKIKKTDKNGLLNIQDYQQVFEQNRLVNQDTFLFISDFNFFWVAKVEGVTDVRPSPQETLSIYEHEDVEIWFKIKDMDLLCGNPTSTRSKIAKLSHENIKSLNPYVAGLRYPLVVDDLSLESYFAKYKDKKRILVPNNLIDESSTTKFTLEDQISYTIPKANFEKLPALLKKKVLWAEEQFSELHDCTPSYEENLSKVAFSYLRILEAVLNFTLMKEIDLRIDEEKGFHDLSQIHHILNCLSWKNHNVNELMGNTVHESFWEFCKIDVRNFLHVKIGDHQLHAIKTEELLSSAAALFIRNSMLGVGCKGILNELIERYQPMDKVQIDEEELDKVS